MRFSDLDFAVPGRMPGAAYPRFACALDIMRGVVPHEAATLLVEHEAAASIEHLGAQPRHRLSVGASLHQRGPASDEGPASDGRLSLLAHLAADRFLGDDRFLESDLGPRDIILGHRRRKPE